MSGLKSKLSDLGITPSIESDPGCLDVRGMPSVFLRFESPRQQVALPYAALLKLELSLDNTEAVLTFIAYSVTVKGKNLAKLYTAVSQAQAVQISVARKDFTMDAALMAFTPFVSDIRIVPLTETDRRRR